MAQPELVDPVGRSVPPVAGPEPAPQPVLARVRTRLPEFTGALQRVAEQVLADPAGAARATIVELAERSGTSPATVTRFCRALGFEGYADLRLGIAGETGRAARSAGWTVDIGREIQPTDPLDRVLGQIMAADTRAMHDTAALLDLREVERAADAIASGGRLDIYGEGGSALVGGEMQVSLHRIGVAAWVWHDVHNGLASAAQLRPGDVALGISHSGQTRETIELLAEAGSHGARTVALTSFPRSPLAEVADIVLLTCGSRRSTGPAVRSAAGRPAAVGPDGATASQATASQATASQATASQVTASQVTASQVTASQVTASQVTAFRPDALSARHPQLVVLDLLYIAVAQRTHERAHAAFQRTARAVDGHKRIRGDAKPDNGPR